MEKKDFEDIFSTITTFEGGLIGAPPSDQKEPKNLTILARPTFFQKVSNYREWIPGVLGQYLQEETS